MDLKRNWHYLRPAKGCGLPKNAYALVTCVRIESDMLKHNESSFLISEWQIAALRKGGRPCCEASEMSGGESTSLLSALAGFCAERGVSWVVAMDWVAIASQCGLWDAFACGEWSLVGSSSVSRGSDRPLKSNQWSGIAIVDDPPFLLRCRPTGMPGQLHLVDTRNYGLDNWGQLNDTGSASSNANTFVGGVGTKEGSERQSRCELIRRWALRLFASAAEIQSAGLRGTCGSTAMHAYRARYLNNLILVHSNADAIALERSSFHPGRCEAFRLGYIEGPVWETDFTSMYPAVAADALLPVRFRRIIKGKDLDYEHIKASGYLSICQAVIETDRQCVPKWRRGRSVYPVGKFATTLCGPELEIALRTARSVVIQVCALYEPEVLFSKCFREWFAQRRQAKVQGDNVWAAYWKRSMLALIGKFGQRNQRWQDAESDIGREAFECWYTRSENENGYQRWRNVAGKTQKETEPEEHPEGVCAISSWVASLARSKLTECIMSLGTGATFYCDTDSMWISQSGINKLLPVRGTNANIGELRQVGGPHSWLWVYGQKHIDAECKRIHSGIPYGAERLSEREFRWTSPERFAWSVRRGGAPTNKCVEHSYRLNPHYQVGIVGEGGAIYPFRYNEDEENDPIQDKVQAVHRGCLV